MTPRSLLVLGVALAALSSGSAQAQPAAEEYYVVPVAGSPVRGAADALVTIVEFADFQCPFSGRVTATIQQALQQYAGRVSLVFKNNPLPFHTNAALAAEAALAAGAQGRYWEMHDKLFANQQALARPDLERYAAELGLMLPAFRQALDGHVFAPQVAADQALAAQLGATGTPSFFVNGRPVRGAQPFSTFQTVIDAQIAAATRLLASGTPRRALYTALTQGGLTQAVARSPSRPSTPDAPPAREDPEAIYRVDVGVSPALGRGDALVTIVEWMDYQCPFSNRVRETLRRVQERYGPNVRLVAKMNPLAFHPEAMPAAEAAMAAHAQGLFWEMHERLFDAASNQSLGRPTYDRIAREIGLNMDRFTAELDRHTHLVGIEADQRQATQLGASGTPSFFVNGRKLTGAQAFERFQTLIDQEQVRARTTLRRQHPRPGQLYELLIAGGATAPVMLAGATVGEEGTPVYRLTLPRRAPSRGGRRARVVIQEFADFQCPFSARVQAVLQQLSAEYGDRIRLVWRNFPLPFHQGAPLAHEAALAAHAQGKFWPFHDLLFANQRALERGDLVRYAAEAGLDVRRFEAALDRHTHRAAVEADVRESNATGAHHGTPAFFINGHLLQGAQPIEAFRTAIDAALSRRR